MRQITLTIGGMSCDHCRRAVTAALSDIPGVAIERVTIGTATLRFDPAVAQVGQLVSAIAEAGYEVLEPVPW